MMINMKKKQKFFMSSWNLNSNEIIPFGYLRSFNLRPNKQTNKHCLNWIYIYIYKVLDLLAWKHNCLILVMLKYTETMLIIINKRWTLYISVNVWYSKWKKSRECKIHSKAYPQDTCGEYSGRLSDTFQWIY